MINQRDAQLSFPRHFFPLLFYVFFAFFKRRTVMTSPTARTIITMSKVLVNPSKTTAVALVCVGVAVTGV